MVDVKNFCIFIDSADFKFMLVLLQIYSAFTYILVYACVFI